MVNTTRKAALAIQCTASNGDTGSFLFVPGSEPMEAISPVCKDLVELFKWTKRNGWEGLPFDHHWPVGLYEQRPAEELP